MPFSALQVARALKYMAAERNYRQRAARHSSRLLRRASHRLAALGRQHLGMHLKDDHIAVALLAGGGMLALTSTGLLLLLTKQSNRPKQKKS